VERAARTPERRDHEDREEHRPDPAREIEEPLTRCQEENTGSGDRRGDAGHERPLLGLACAARRGNGEQSEPGAEADERTADDLRLGASGEHPEDEQEPDRQPGGDRGEDDEPDVASLGLGGGGRADCGRGGCCVHDLTSSLDLDTNV
jgi:hypothetical protein